MNNNIGNQADIIKNLREERCKPIYRAPIGRVRESRGRRESVIHFFPKRVHFRDGYIDISFTIKDGRILTSLSTHVATVSLPTGQELTLEEAAKFLVCVSMKFGGKQLCQFCPNNK
ncbi:MAG: hypothetical protein OEM02_03775 [Desulfobulbaceae bacterium]|nr:hypothetical protein [Desulfobulbaceae bacterium]